MGALVATLVLLVPESSNAAPSLNLSRSSVIAGESIKVTGTISGRAARTVVLQRKNSRDVWVPVTRSRSTRTGAFTFSYRPPMSATPVVLRAVAPATKVGGRRLARAVTHTRTVRTSAGTALIAAHRTVASTAVLTVSGSFAPARPGRPTDLQRWDGTSWSTMAVGTQDQRGVTTFQVGLVEPGARELRVRTLAKDGAPTTSSAVHRITVTESEQDPPVEAAHLDDGPTGATAIAGDSEAIITWDLLPQSEVSGYRVYAAPALEGPWTSLTPEPLGPDHEGTFTADNLTNDVSYVFAVTSLSGSGLESRRSLTELVTPTRQPEPPAPEDPCGPVAPKDDGTAWACTLAEDFDGTTFDKRHWFPQQIFATGTSSNFACYRNTPETISVADGVLSLSVVRVETPVSCSFGGLSGSTDIIAGSLMSYQRFTQQYGRFEARIKTHDTKLPGLQEAFWLWPDDRVRSEEVWPVAGEIDVSETYSRHPTFSIPFLHYRADADGPQNGVNTAYCPANRGVWNTYTMTWTAERIEIRINGKHCLVNESGDSAFMKPYLLAFTAALGVGDNAYDGRIPLPATMQVDYVRAWK